MRSIFRAAPSSLRVSAGNAAAALLRLFAIRSMLKPKFQLLQAFSFTPFRKKGLSKVSASLGTSGRDFPVPRSHEPVVKNKSKTGNREKEAFVFRRYPGGFLVVKLNL